MARTALPSTSLCSTLSYSQVFLPFGDANLYTLTPQGSFEGPIDGWTVTGSAKVVADAGYAGGPVADTASLELSAGSTATSPPICANASTPTFRFFAKALTAGAGTAGVAVSYLDAAGNKYKGTGSFAAATTWNPTAEFRVRTNKIATDASGWGYVQISVTAPSDSALRIDDLYLDPRMH